MKCEICGKDKKTVELQPSRKQLIFGGFPIRFEYRCQRCETILAKQLSAVLKGRETVSNTDQK